MRRALLIHNPRAGGARNAQRLARARAALRASGVDVVEAACQSPEASAQSARAASNREDLDVVLVFGGDGTVRLVAAELAGSAVPLGVLPGGTTNVVAAALGIPSQPERAVAALLRSQIRELDLGLCGEAPFLMQATAGLDARIMGGLDPRLKRRFGKGAVVWAGLREWSRYRFPVIEVELDGRREAVTGVAVCNLAEYAGRFRLIPDGRADDQHLDLLLFRGRRRRDALGFALSLLVGRHDRRRDIEIRSASEVTLLGPPETPLQLDGDPWPAKYPLRIALAPTRLRVLAPSPAEPALDPP